MIKNFKALTIVGALGLGIAGIAGCSSNSPSSVLTPQTPAPVQSVNPNPANPAVNTATFTQIEFLGKPAIKEVFEPFNSHSASNAIEPYNDTTLQSDIMATEDTVRPANSTVGTDYGKTLSSTGVLWPAIYQVNLSGAGSGSYLGVETKGATGSTFGGRNPADDVIDISLGALFGPTLSKLGVLADDGEENNCLAQENLTQNPAQAPSSTFPYLHSPH